jgi:nitronate monooxygenase
MIGSRFQATAEAVADPAVKKAIVDGRGEDTLGHPLLDQWRGREAELAAEVVTAVVREAELALSRVSG